MSPGRWKSSALREPWDWGRARDYLATGYEASFRVMVYVKHVSAVLSVLIGIFPLIIIYALLSNLLMAWPPA